MHPSTWGIPGGALRPGEQPLAGALRELTEETGLRATGSEATRYVFEPAPEWRYTTLVVDVESLEGAEAATWESAELRWVTRSEMEALPLHPDFRAALAKLLPPQAARLLCAHMPADAAVCESCGWIGRDVPTCVELSGEKFAIGWRFWHVLETDNGFRIASPGLVWRHLARERAQPWRPGEEFRAVCVMTAERREQLHNATRFRNSLSVIGQYAPLLPRELEPHDAPHPSCWCGVAAARDAKTIYGFLDRNRSPDYLWQAFGRESRARVIGRTVLTGRIIEDPDPTNRDGFRGARGYPIELYVSPNEPSDTDRIVADLAAYGVPIDVIESLEFVYGQVA